MQVITQNDRMERMSDYLRGEAARSLELMRDIDGTIEALVLVRRQMDGCREAVESLIKMVNGSTKGAFSEDEIIPSLEQSQELLKKLDEDFSRKLAAAKCAPELRSDDGVDDAYVEALNAVHLYNEAIETLKWCVLEHNADMEGRKGSQMLTNDKDIDDLFDNL